MLVYSKSLLKSCVLRLLKRRMYNYKIMFSRLGQVIVIICRQGHPVCAFLGSTD